MPSLTCAGTANKTMSGVLAGVVTALSLTCAGVADAAGTGRVATKGTTSSKVVTGARAATTAKTTTITKPTTKAATTTKTATTTTPATTTKTAPAATTTTTTTNPVVVADSFAPVAQALPTTTENARFKSWTWSPVDTTKTDYQTSMVWAGKAGGWCQSDPAVIAAQLKARPAGQRVLFLWDISQDLVGNAGDRAKNWDKGNLITTNFASPWLDNGIATVKARVETLLDGIKAAGGTVDAVILDNESTLQCWCFNTPGQFSAIQLDPRFPTLAQTLGFSNLSLISFGNSYFQKWNSVAGAMFDAALQQAVAGPVAARFPAAVVSNYESMIISANARTPWIGSSMETRESAGFGTHDADRYYGIISSSFAKYKPDGLNEIGSDAFAAMRLSTHRVRAGGLSSSRGQQAWIAPFSYGACSEFPGDTTPLTGSTQWDEMVLQLAMNGVETFIMWNPSAWTRSMNTADWNKVSDQQHFDGLLKELNTNLGQNPGTPLYFAQPSFGDKVVATGRQVGNKMVWRFSFAAGVTSAKVFFTDGSTAVVSAEQGRSGAWFSHSSGKQLEMNAALTAPRTETPNTSDMLAMGV